MLLNDFCQEKFREGTMSYCISSIFCLFSFQARLVAAATGSLCEAANAAIQGNCSEEKLVASAKAVSNSTAQLLLACCTRADPNSKTQKGLQVN